MTTDIYYCMEHGIRYAKGGGTEKKCCNQSVVTGYIELKGEELEEK